MQHFARSLSAAHRAVILCTLGLSACAPVAAQRQLQSLSRIVDSATKQGAAACAPEELAMARVQLEFAQLELAQGEGKRAERHLILAEPNAKAALRVATSPSCHRTAQRAPASTTSRPLVAVGGSRDPERDAP